MKTKILKIGFLAVAAGVMLMFSTCTKDDNITNDVKSSQAVLKSGAGPSAHGLGMYANKWNGFSHIRFNAITKANGTVQGSGELKHFLGDDRYCKYTIECLTVTGNVAVMGGTITESTFELMPVGARVLVRAIDNGQGGQDPDQYTGVWYEGAPGWIDEWDCDNFLEQDLLEIEQGNLVVNP